MKNQSARKSNRFRILVFCVALLSLACAGVVVSAESEAKWFVAPQTPAAEKTVEQVQKNIQVLKGLPQSQLIPTMNYIAVSLGVKCTFCHVKKNDTWDFALDAKPEKATAREMITMTLNLNKTNFKGATEVTCNTCHRGRSHPAAAISLPLPLAPAAAANAEAKPKETPPTVDQILDKYVEALGGKAAIDKLQSRVMKGSWVTPDGITLGYEVYQAGPDKLYTVLNTPKQGTFEKGFDGTVGWEKSTHGVRTLEDSELFYLRRYPDLFKDIKLKEQFTRLSFGGKEKIDDKEVYVLRGTTADNKRERLYFDVQTGLLLRRSTSMTNSIGVIPDQVDFEDYRDAGGVKLPFTIRVSSIDSFFSSTRKFSEIKVNVPVDQSKFSKPAGAPAAPAGR